MLDSNRSFSINQLAELIRSSQNVTLLTGAGISVASGLPVYRDANGNWVHSKPVEGPAFRADEKIRQRYWCRSFFGWPAFSQATPNAVHHDINWIRENHGDSTVITQNVDGLHQQCGHNNTIALHGNLSEVICIECGDLTSRQFLQTRLEQCNPDFIKLDAISAPDGDALIDDKHIQKFKIANCQRCNGVLKPNVVFFGDNVPKERVMLCRDRVLQSGVLVCIGTSLMVYSGFRFCRAAHEASIPIAIINNGKTRADDMADFKIEGDCTANMADLKRALQQLNR